MAGRYRGEGARCAGTPAEAQSEHGLIVGALFTQFPWTCGGAHCEHAAMWRTRTFGVAVVAALCLTLLACSKDAGTGRESLTITATVAAMPSAPDAVATTRPTRMPTVTPSPTPTPAARQPWATDSRVTNVSLDGFELCRLSDLTAFQVEGQGAGGGMWDSVGIANRGTEPCRLGGEISTELIGSPDGTEGLKTHDSATGPSVLLPPTRAPFEQHVRSPVMALVTFSWSTWPETCPSRTFLPFTGAIVRFERIGSLPPVALLGHHSACAERGVGVSSLRLAGPYGWPAPWLDPQLNLLPQLGVVHFELPQSYSYELRLTNQGHAPLLSSDYCRPFIQVFQPLPTTPFAGSSKPSFAQKVELSGCESMSPLAPGESAEFEIRFDPPLGATGSYQLLWLSFGTDDPYLNTSRQVRLR